MSEEQEKKRAPRFRRSARFRSPKEPPDLSTVQKSPEAPPAEGSPLERSRLEEPAAPSSTPPTFAPEPSEVIPTFSPFQTEIDDNFPKVAPIFMYNALTIDVKEWFQTAACSEVVKFSHWGKYERRVERGVHMILALLREHSAKATFFILGIVAREFPELVKLIVQEGHEIGTMGYYNRQLHTITPKEYITEIEMSLSLLKSLIGRDITLHRAPEWSVTQHTMWVFDILKAYGIRCDSSVYPVNSDLYGIEKAPRFPYVIDPQGIIEFPPSTYSLAGKNIALFGGTNLRVLPIGLISMGIESINYGGNPVMIHLSPWEIDGEFPKLDLGWNGYLSQYAGVKSTFLRFAKLLEKFQFDTISGILEKKPAAQHINIGNINRGLKSRFADL